MKARLLIWPVIVAALLALPGLETYRYYVARQQLTASETLLRSVEEKLQIAKVKSAPVAKNNNADLKAVSNRP